MSDITKHCPCCGVTYPGNCVAPCTDCQAALVPWLLSRDAEIEQQAKQECAGELFQEVNVPGDYWDTRSAALGDLAAEWQAGVACPESSEGGQEWVRRDEIHQRLAWMINDGHGFLLEHALALAADYAPTAPVHCVQDKPETEGGE